jgi:hypothetical protein
MRTIRLREPAAIVAIVCLHAVLIAALYWQMRFHSVPRALEGFESEAAILPPARLTSNPLPVEPQRSRALTSIVPEPILQPPPILDDGSNSEAQSRAPTNWAEEGRRVIGRFAEEEAAKLRQKEEEAARRQSKTPSAPKHFAGENYSSPTRKVVWINDRCYVESEAPPPGTPDFLARARISRTACPGASDGMFSGEMFKDLPAYKREHAVDPSGGRSSSGR